MGSRKRYGKCKSRGQSTAFCDGCDGRGNSKCPDRDKSRDLRHDAETRQTSKGFNYSNKILNYIEENEQ